MTKTRTVLALSALAWLAGCMDLKEVPVTGVSSDFLATTSGANAAVVGVYSRLNNFYGQETEILMTELGTDSWQTGDQSQGNGFWWNDYSSALNSSITDPLLNRWQNFYQAINAANTAIVAINGSSLDAATKTIRLAELRFLRAKYYEDLVRLWGAVEIDTLPTVGVVTTATRSPVADVFAKVIIPDLQFAVANLPLKQADVYRATKGAAQTLLAEVYLTRAAPGDFDLARDLTSAVISSGVYKLNANYRSLFCGPSLLNGACDYLAAQKSDPELIFSVQYLGDGAVDVFGSQLHLEYTMNYDNSAFASPGLARTAAYGRPFRRASPNKHLLGVWNRNTDSRYLSTFQVLWRQPNGDTAIFFPGTPTAAKTGVQGKRWGESEDSLNLYPTMMKWLDQTRDGPNQIAGHRDRPLWRFGEVYLLRAEANVRGGHASDAIADINVLRVRAAVPGQDNTMSATELAAFGTDPLGFVLDERERELAGEEFRWFTLARQGTAVFLARIKANNPFAVVNVKDFHILRPIPQGQIDRTDGGNTSFAQNPGY
ncbi:MAG: RagB/SusD family nutrient uptake outer membrane protein [bacterium]